MLQKQFFQSGYVSKLSDDNQKDALIKLIKGAIQKIRHSQEMNIIAQNADFEGQICSGFKAQQTKSGGQQVDYIDKVLTNVQRKEKVPYTVKFDAKRDACDV